MNNNKRNILENLRKEINNLDEQLIKLLSERRKLSEKIVELKAIDNIPLRDETRETELLKRIVRIAETNGLEVNFVKRIFYEILDDSIRVQQSYLQKLANQNEMERGKIRVAIQGVEGSYSFLAAKKFFAHSNVALELVSYERFEDAAHAVESGKADYALLPIENTTSGGINEVFDLLLHTSLSIVGEEKFEIRHCLVAPEKIELDSIKKIYAHYQAAAQCSRFIAGLKNVAIEYFADTAMSVQKIKEENNPEYTAIASEEAAQLYGVTILMNNIANQTENYTRFVVCARKPVKVDPRIPCKTSLVMATAHIAGSLVDALNVFRKYDLNLTKLESRPVLGNPWEEMFYVDFEGNVDDDNVVQALNELNPFTRFVKVLGSYPSRDIERTKVKREK